MAFSDTLKTAANPRPGSSTESITGASSRETYHPSAAEWTTPHISTDIRVDRGLTGLATRIGSAIGCAIANVRSIRSEVVKRPLRSALHRYPAAILAAAWVLGIVAGRAMRKR